MPNDPLALSNISTEPPEQGNDEAAPGDLAEIAAAIARIEAEIGSDATPAPDAFAAIERIADIAYVLHERSVEPTLCDGIDAALREISDASARSEAAAQRAQKIAEMLRALSNRIGAMIARSTAERRAELPTAESASVGTNDATREIVDEDAGSLEQMIESGKTPEVALFDLDAEQTENLAQAVAALVASLPALAEASGPEPDAAGQPAREAQLSEQAAAEPAPSARLLPSIFELPAAPNENSAERLEDGVRAGPGSTEDQAPSHASSVDAAAPSARAIPNPAAADALAAVRALSEEELIALFS
jgi:hypothetical protein